MVSLLEVLAVEVPNRPGSLQAVADLLGRNQINLDNCSGFVANNRAILVIEVHELAQARAVLEKAGPPPSHPGRDAAAVASRTAAVSNTSRSTSG